MRFHLAVVVVKVLVLDKVAVELQDVLCMTASLELILLLQVVEQVAVVVPIMMVEMLEEVQEIGKQLLVD